MQQLTGARVLVSGGTGFIGSHLVRRLVSEQANVYVLARKQSSVWRLSDVLSNVTICEGNIADPSAVLGCMKVSQPDFIFNVAGMRKIDRDIRMLDLSLDINLAGTLNFFKAIQELNLSLKAFVQTGTFEEYGLGPIPFRESQREEPISPYSASKLAATQFCQMLYRSLNYQVVVLRPCLMYGPYQAVDMFIPLLIQACLRGENFPMTEGLQTRDLGFVTDVIDAYILAVSTPAAIGEVINIGTAREHTIKEIAEKIVEISGSKTELQFGKIPTRVAEIKRLVCDNTKAKNILGWSPKTGLDDGLRETIEWYRNNLKEFS